MPTYLRPTGPIASRALLPGDPKVAMELAGALLEKPVMTNLSRGLWGYHGRAADGEDLTVQSSGIGGPSSAAVARELAGLGVRRIVRLGACVALDPGLAPGSALIVERASTHRDSELVGPDPALPAAELTARLAAARSARVGAVLSSDLLALGSDPEDARDSAAVAVDLSSAAVLSVARRCGVAAAAALIAAETADGRRLSDGELAEALLELGRVAAGSLGPDQGAYSAEA